MTPGACETCRWYRERPSEAATQPDAPSDATAQRTLALKQPDELRAPVAFGECRRMPPTSSGPEQLATWPLVRGDREGCGELVGPRPVASARGPILTK